MPAPILVPMPSQGTVAGRPRKESIYDTEVYVGAAAAARQLSTFSNLVAFATAPTTTALTKQFGRDANLRGTSSGGLPAAAHFFWYGWRCYWNYMGSNLNTDANLGATELLHRIMGLCYVQFNFQTSNLLTLKAVELPSGVGPQHIATTRTGGTVFSLPNGIPDRKNSKDMLIMGRPIELGANEQFTIDFFVPQSPTDGSTPVEDLFVVPTLDGILGAASPSYAYAA